MNTEILLTTSDLARRWQTSEQAVYAARHRGDCPRAVKRGRRLLWRLNDVEAWEEARAQVDQRNSAARGGNGGLRVASRRRTA